MVYENDIKIAKMEVSIDNIEKTQFKQDQKLDKLMDAIEKLDTKLGNHMIEEQKYVDKKLEAHNDKFADKKTEYIVNGLVITILLAVLGALLKFVILS